MILILFLIIVVIELTYSPRIEFTRERDVLLMYFDKNNKRAYKILFKL